MKVTVNINYRTNWGEAVYLSWAEAPIGTKESDDAIKMNLTGFDSWFLTFELPDKRTCLEYYFTVRSEDGTIKREWGKPHRLDIAKGVGSLTILANWQDQPTDKHYYSSAFVDGIFKRTSPAKLATIKGGEIFFSVAAPNISSNEALAIVGSTQQLGDWDPKKAVVMNDSQFPFWSVSLKAAENNNFSYKFIIIEKKTKKVVAWENSGNRTFDYTFASKKDSVAVQSLIFNNPKANYRGAGTAIPVFSLRSNEDFGVGDFYDLFKMIDWALDTRQNIVQILPINDTTMTGTWTDSYPYNANSTFALHPMYLRVEAIGELTDKKKKKEYEKIKSELNALPEIDYERVNNVKNAYIRDLYRQLGSETIQSQDFQKFVEANSHWLKDYAAFCVLRDLNQTPDFSKWGEYAEYNPEKVDAFVKANIDEINFIYFQQYHLDKQLSEVRNYAHQKGVVLKGDIPIGISRTSADAWVYPRLFNMDCQAGAPPDDFSILGQNWGFPTYNWEEMSLDGFKWWKDRFVKMSQYFDAYRIDHILGFFRIWEIPMNAVHGLLGVFNPALPYTPEEMRDNYDFWIDVDLYTKPYIMDWMLGDFFGEYADEVRRDFLIDWGYGRYALRDTVNTQRKVEKLFATLEKNDKNIRISDGLMGLIDQVLFIEDSRQKGHYHPRISAQNTYIYRSLNDYQKWCYDRLYNDFFYRRHNEFWYGKAMWKLPPLINATDMLVCGEDLGMIPDCVSAVMSNQQILSLEIQRMPKDPKAEFGNTWYYPYLCVATTSTHDMSGIRGWWEENREKTQHFYNNVLHESGQAPYFAEPWICTKIVGLHLNSPAMLTILPLQDWLSMDGSIRRENPAEEQINIPANSRHYWRYRMHLTLEELINNKDFNTTLRNMIMASGR